MQEKLAEAGEERARLQARAKHLEQQLLWGRAIMRIRRYRDTLQWRSMVQLLGREKMDLEDQLRSVRVGLRAGSAEARLFDEIIEREQDEADADARLDAEMATGTDDGNSLFRTEGAGWHKEVVDDVRGSPALSGASPRARNTNVCRGTGEAAAELWRASPSVGSPGKARPTRGKTQRLREHVLAALEAHARVPMDDKERSMPREERLANRLSRRLQLAVRAAFLC